jgi:hypothetical protein
MSSGGEMTQKQVDYWNSWYDRRKREKFLCPTMWYNKDKQSAYSTCIKAFIPSEPVQLEQTPCASAESASELQGVIIDVDAGVEPTGCAPVTADAGVSAPDGEREE